jgi:hypothetical protein
MPIITKAQLNDAASRKLGLYESISGEIRKALNDTRLGKSVTIFLSHSHRDKDEVEKAVVFLRKLGISVYIDWMDDEMPAVTSGTTAARIKEKIKENRKFILLATNNAVASKWCNWELGFGDAAKYINHISLFPLAENSGAWNGNEYLQIYPRIERETTQLYIGGRVSENWYVIYPDKRKVSLEDWLKL